MQTTSYITNGVLIGLHNHKAGQYRSLKRVTCLSVGLLVLVLVASFVCMNDGSVKVPVAVYRVNGPPPGGRPSGALLLSPSKTTDRLDPFIASNFPIGYVGKIRIVSDAPRPVVSTMKLPKSITVQVPTPGTFESLDSFGLDGLGGSSFGDGDFGLPDPAPLWTFTSRGLPAGMVDQVPTLPVVSQQAHAMLYEPIWPEDVWLVDDTAVVEGWLTLHSYGLMSFELISEAPPGKGFAAAVKTAVERGQCVPATDSRNNRITVRCRYRCLFFHGAQPAVSIGGKVTARVRKDQ